MTQLLVPRNSKIGEIYNFSLPVFVTCPCMTQFCKQYCYGTHNWYRKQWMKDKLQEKFELSSTDDFVRQISNEINIARPKVIRIHITGDFYSVGYIQKWHDIISAFPDIIFYGYTRVWRDVGLNHVIQQVMHECSNLHLRASVDFTHIERPNGWLQYSTVQGEGMHCPHDLDEVDSCEYCGQCWTTTLPSIWTSVKTKSWTNLSPYLL
jgi:hypothetical protein